jgi:DNA polymerase (family 10)
MKSAKFINNQEISALLKAVSAAYQVKNENMFKVAAYDRAAVAIEHASSELKDLWDDKKLEDIPGVGKSIAAHLDELFRTGRVKHFEQIFKNLPPAMFVFINIKGIGPKNAYKLAKTLSISSTKQAISKLFSAAKSGKIAKMEGFGEKSQELIIEGIKAYQKGTTKQNRMNLVYADQLANTIMDYLSQIPETLRVDTLGSLRRKVSTIGDIDISVATKKSEVIIGRFLAYPKRQKIIEKGESGATIILSNGCQVDLRVQNPDSYGSMLQYFTGSKQHNIHLREMALKKGLSLSEHGIKQIRNPIVKLRDKILKYKTEEGFYKFIGMKYIPPELREDTGEIEAGLQNRLPKIVELKDIKGDLHTHSNIKIEESHDPGMDSMARMVEEAKLSGYEYIGFSEHNPSQNKHEEKQILDLLKIKKEAIEQINYSGVNKVFKIFNGMEADIKPSGELAIPQKAFELLDFVIASVHSEFDLNREKMTRRVLCALDNPKVKIFGHPTGRLLGKREGYELDWEKVFGFCSKHNKWLEINAFPDRLDLPDNLVRQAVKYGVKMVINTDSHSSGQLSLMKYGVDVAKRGWATKNDIANTQSCGKMIQILKGGEIK